MTHTLANILLWLAIFFLPWQTQAIFSSVSIQGEPSSYGVFGIYVVEVFIIAAYLLRGRQHTRLAVQRILQSLYFVLSAVFLSIAFSQIEWVGWFQAIHLLSAVMLFSLLVDDRTNRDQMLGVFLLGLILPILLGWFQVLSGGTPDSTLLGMSAKDAAVAGTAVVQSGEVRLLRAYGTFPHPNIFGGYIAFGILVLAWLTRFLHGRQRLVGMLLVSVLLGTTLIMTFSRSAWLGLFVSLLVLLSLMLWQKRIPPRRAMPVMIVGLASILSTILLFHGFVFSRFDPSIRIEAISLEERSNQYQTFDEVFTQSIVWGVGPGAYTFVLERLFPGQPVWSYQPIHNTYLLILAELGLIGVLALGYSFFKINPVAHGSIPQVGTWFGVTAWLLLLVIGLFDHYLWSLWPGLALTSFGVAAMVHWTYLSDPSTAS